MHRTRHGALTHTRLYTRACIHMYKHPLVSLSPFNIFRVRVRIWGSPIFGDFLISANVHICVYIYINIYPNKSCIPK